jgi:hypothetical protein
MRTHEGTASLRYLAPPTMLILCALGALLGIAAFVFGITPLAIGFAVPFGYALLLTLGSARETRGQSLSVRAWLPVVLATMHWSWGWGFLTSPRSLFESTQR